MIYFKWDVGNFSQAMSVPAVPLLMSLKKSSSSSHLTIFLRGMRTTSKIQRNNSQDMQCGPSFAGKTLSVPLIVPERFRHGYRTYQNSTMRELVCNGQLWARAALRQLRSYTVGQREHFPATVW